MVPSPAVPINKKSCMPARNRSFFGAQARLCGQVNGIGKLRAYKHVLDGLKVQIGLVFYLQFVLMIQPGVVKNWDSWLELIYGGHDCVVK